MAVHFYREERIFFGTQQSCHINNIVNKEVYVNRNGLNPMISYCWKFKKSWVLHYRYPVLVILVLYCTIIVPRAAPVDSLQLQVQTHEQIL